MGWLVGYLDQGYNEKQAVAIRDRYLRDACRMSSYDDPACSNIVLASAFRGSTWYAAVQINRPGVETFVTAFIFLTRSTNRREFGYKDMDETVGPCEVDCPMKIMRLLTPLKPGEYPHAEAWRKSVLEHHKLTSKRRAAADKLVGKLVRLPTPLFYGGVPISGGTVVRVQVSRKRSALCFSANGSFYRIPQRVVESLQICTPEADAADDVQPELL